MPILAIGAVDLVALLVALAALLALVALDVLLRPLTNILKHVSIPGFIPVFGGDNLGDAIEGGLQSAMQGVIASYDSVTHGVAHFFWTLGVGVWHFVYKAVAAIADAKTTALQALGVASGAEAGAVAVASSLFNTAEHDISSASAAVLGDAEALYNAAIAHADAVGDTVLGDAEALYNAAVGQIAAGDATVLGDAEALYNAAVAHADAVGDTVLGDAEALYNAAVAQIASTADVINAHVDQILGEAESFADDAATAAAAAAAAGVLSQVIPRVAALEAEATECIEPMCEALQPNLSSLGKVGSLFSLLEGGTLWVLLAALLAEAATDPGAAVADVEATIAPLVNDTVGGLRDLIGV